MIVFYKLKDLMNRRGIKDYMMCKMAGISSSTMCKLWKGENVFLDTLNKICAVLNCQPADIMEYVPEADAKAKLATRLHGNTKA